MYYTAVTVVLFAAILESLIIIVGNIFTIFVFWKNRNRLNRTTFLVINLAVADLLVGITEPISIGAFTIPGHFEKKFKSDLDANSSSPFQIAVGFSSILFLTLISLERAYALIWPLRHRVTSTKAYIYSATLAWIATIFAGVGTLLTIFNIFDFANWKVALVGAKVLCLVMICVSYLAIRTRLRCRVPVTDGARNGQNEHQQNAKLSRTLFIMITVSLVFWVPSLVVYSTLYLCPPCIPLLVLYIFTRLFRLANSLVNPIIYSFRIPMFRETFKRVKSCKQSKKYKINYSP